MTDYSAEYKRLRVDYSSPGKDVEFRSGLRALCVKAREEGEQLWHLFFSARVFREDGELDKAVEAFDELIETSLQIKKPESSLLQAMGLLAKGVTLKKQKKSDEAIAAYDEVVKRFGKTDEPELKPQVAKALINKGNTLDDQKKPHEAIGAYDEVVKRFGKDDEPELRRGVASALFNKAYTLKEQKKRDEAVAAYNELIERLCRADEPELKRQVAEAMINKGVTLREQRKLDEAIVAYDEMVKRFAKADELGLRERVASALFNKANTLKEQKKHDEAVAAYNEVVKRFGKADEPELKVKVAKALLNNGATLHEQQKADEAIATWEEVIERFGEADEPRLKRQVAAALVNKGSTLDEQKKPDEAIAAYDEVATRFGKAEEPELKEQVARALVGKGVTLNEQRRPREAIATWDEVIRRLANAESHRLRPFLGWSLAYKGYVQGRAGNVGEAKRTFRRARQVLPKDEFVQQLAAASISTSKDRVYAGSRKRATETISVYIEALLEQFKPDQQNEFFTKMREREQRTQDFLADTSRFVSDGGSRALLLDLREWNSYTPLVPDQHEVDRGGGYFIRYKNQGIVIDPGFDFIKNFGDADGRVCDIDHVVITHAHNDHTQDFESLLSLVHQHNRKHKDKIKRIHLYLSHGAARKCSGYVPLRDVEYIQTIDILNQGRRDNPQTIHLHGLLGARLTVLRAYHDDTITLDYSVGLGFEFDFGGTTRTVVFTGDTGLFPPKRGVGGKPTLREDDEPVLDIDMEGSKALYNEYPERFRRPDLLVPHLGSIKKYEFTKLESLPPAQEQANTPLLFYPNHLGIRGLIILLDKLRPKVAIISEFGEELKDVRFKLVEGISQLLEKRRAPKENAVFLVPGDFTVVYDIGEGAFFCHDTKKFHKPPTPRVVESDEPEGSRYYSPGVNRTYLFAKKESVRDAKFIVEKYHLDVTHHGQPYCRCATTRHGGRSKRRKESK